MRCNTDSGSAQNPFHIHPLYAPQTEDTIYCAALCDIAIQIKNIIPRREVVRELAAAAAKQRQQEAD